MKKFFIFVQSKISKCSNYEKIYFMQFIIAVFGNILAVRG